jgi:hypothetical protein
MDQEALRSALRAGIVTINFIKHNGADRTMKATLAPKYLPDTDAANETAIVRQGEVLTVWDTEQNGWRSMRLDSIKEWTTEQDATPKADVKTNPASYVG